MMMMMMIKDVSKKSDQIETIQQCRAILLYNDKLQFSDCSHCCYLSYYIENRDNDVTYCLYEV